MYRVLLLLIDTQFYFFFQNKTEAPVPRRTVTVPSFTGFFFLIFFLARSIVIGCEGVGVGVGGGAAGFFASVAPLKNDRHDDDPPVFLLFCFFASQRK